MGDTRDLYGRASRRLGDKVMSIADDQWTGSTPCSDWDVRALVNHLASENAWIPPLLAGKTIADVGDALDGDLLGSDPKAAWQRYADEAIEAVDQDGALDRTVHISRGDVSGGEYVLEVLADLIVHGWDLARAIGIDETIEPELLDAAYSFYEPLAELLEPSGAFGDHVEAPPDADRQTKLLAMLGRRAW
jgi:uncharacterized protein (TIGR03086 family)